MTRAHYCKFDELSMNQKFNLMKIVSENEIQKWIQAQPHRYAIENHFIYKPTENYQQWKEMKENI